MIKNIIEKFVIAQEEAAAEWRLNIANEIKDVLKIQIEKTEAKEERPDLSVRRKDAATARLRFLMKKTQPITTDSQITQPTMSRYQL